MATAGPGAHVAIADGMTAVSAPLQGTIISLAVAIDDTVRRGDQLAIMEAMKMEHVVAADFSGIVRALHVEPGDTLWDGQALMTLEPIDDDGTAEIAADEIDLDEIRPDLAEVLARQNLNLDENRPMPLPGGGRRANAPFGKMSKT